MPKRNRAIRNPVARSPLLKKGGVHSQSKTGQRVSKRLQTQSAIDDWLEDIEDEAITQTGVKGSNSSPYCFFP
jgi:hypothetical protein